MEQRSFIGFIIIFLLFQYACHKPPDVQKIVDLCIQKHGGDSYKRMFLGFDFRGRHYTARQFNGLFTYTREFEDSTGKVKDIFTNTGFMRLVNGDTIVLSEKKANAYKNSVNSVIYFALLPFGLNDEAVNKELLGEKMMNGKMYYKIKITFDEKGGGEDYQDIFVYWIDKEDYTMDYLAYLFYEDGGGIRFREAINIIDINGIMIADYNNYAMDDTSFDVTNIDSLFLKNQLKLLSQIDLENIQIDLLENEI